MILLYSEENKTASWTVVRYGNIVDHTSWSKCCLHRNHETKQGTYNFLPWNNAPVLQLKNCN